MTLRALKKDGDVIWLRAGGRPMINRNIVEIQYNAQDITEYKQAEEELESFVSTVTHDLRTPLISLEGFSDILSKEYADKLGVEGNHYLDRIRSGIQRMDEFIESLLQLQICNEDPPKEEVEIEKVVREVVRDLSPRIEENGIEIEIEADMPTFYFEKMQLYQLFSNLISNACKYMGNQEEPKVSVGFEDADGSWILWVEDNGIGIEPEDQDRIFEIFHRAQGSEYEGKGIGLYIVGRIVKTHGGEIWVKSEKGKGSIFYIEFPKENVQN